MTSKTHGKNTEKAEITHISANGVWLLAGGRELFMSFEDFPWFKEASVGKIINIQEQGVGHFYWPDLDVDLTVEIIEHPERFPVKMK